MLVHQQVDIGEQEGTVTDMPIVISERQTLKE